MSYSPNVSVIVPIYNVEKYLRRCIESLINQTYYEIEIILVNDGSPDDSEKICKEYMLKDKRIKLINKENGGLSDARNVGLKNSQGKYVYFIDSDDWCEKNTIECMVTQMELLDVDLCVCGYSVDYFNENFSIIKNLESKVFQGKPQIAESIHELDSNGMFNIVWNKMYKNNIIIENNILFKKDGIPGEDLLFNNAYFKKIHSICFIEEILYHYMRQDEDSLVTQYRENLYSKILYFNQEIELLYKYFDMNNEKYQNVYINKIMENILACIPNIYRDNNLNFLQRQIYLKQIKEDRFFKKNIKKANPKTLNEKIIKIILTINNIYINNILLTFIFCLRYKLSYFYRKLRKITFKY